jgi:cytoskeletal protein CcmA (bactofilin family)
MAKRSKNRFTNLVKFVPDENGEPMQSGFVEPEEESEEYTETGSELFNSVNEILESTQPTIDEDASDVEFTGIDDDPMGGYEPEDDDDPMGAYEPDTDEYEVDDPIGAYEPEIGEVKKPEITEKEEKSMKRSEIPFEGESAKPISRARAAAETASRTVSAPADMTESIILGNTTIKGDVITDAGIQIFGAVIGNIESGGKVQLVGKVEGDIIGKTVVITDTSLNGNITAEEEVYIKKGCDVEGDVKASKVVLNGTIKGNIDAEGQVEFEPGSVIEGNVSAKSFNIKPGARINGSIGTK